MKISAIQTSLHWEDKEKNLEQFENYFKQVSDDTQLIVLPEMFSTGFSMQPDKLAEEMDGWTVSWLKERAWRLGKSIVGSIIIKEEGKYYNRLIWANPDKTLHTYDKRHLFRYANEHEHYTGGDEPLIVELFGFKIACFICYDLRFPVWTRNLNQSYDVALFIANWPASRSHHWKSLLVARAIENQAYVVGVNRVGEDGNGILHSGDSNIIDPLGNAIVDVKPNSNQIVSATLSKEELQEYRKRFPAFLDADAFKII